MTAARKLTVFFGERDRVEGRWLSDLVGSLLQRHRITSAVVLRASEGFGPHHIEQAADLLSLSDDLPLQLIAFDVPERIDALACDLLARHPSARMSGSEGHLLAGLPEQGDAGERDETDLQLTVLVGRRESLGGARAHRALVDIAHACGAAGATAMLGVEGAVDGRHTRGRFFAANGAVAMAVTAVGPRHAILSAAARTADALPGRAVLLETVTLLKRGGAAHGTLPRAHGDMLQLTVHASEDTRRGSFSLGPELIRTLRAGGAAGATSLRGIWGFHGEHEPHGDRLLRPHRGVPLLTTTVADPETVAGSWRVIDEMTQTVGLVTAQRVRRVTAPTTP